MKKALIRTIPILVILVLPALAHAHELEIRSTLAAPAVVLQATYAGTEPVPFAKVQIYSPADVASEFQAANTDKRGYFSYVPDRAGPWRAVIDDELGHRKEIVVQVPERFDASVSGAAPARPARIERAIAGIAILLGATGAWYGYRKSKP